MLLNVFSLESKFQEFIFVGFNDMVFGCVNDQFKVFLQVFVDVVEYVVFGMLIFYQNYKVVGVLGKFMIVFFQFFVQRVEYGIG